MPTYRLYCLNDEGRIVHRYDVDCADDFEAFKEAHEFCGDSAIEVWLGSRRIHAIPKGAKFPQGGATDAGSPSD